MEEDSFLEMAYEDRVSGTENFDVTEYADEIPGIQRVCECGVVYWDWDENPFCGNCDFDGKYNGFLKT